MGAMSSMKKKTRTLVVRRSQPIEPEKSMKQIVVSRAPRPGEELLPPVQDSGAPVRVKGVRRDAAGRPIERSILGTAEVFSDVEADEAPDPYVTETLVPEEPTIPPEATSARAPSAATVSSRVGSKPGTADPSAERMRYLGRLKTGITAAEQATKEEAREEAAHAEQLPASERFSLDRDGKVMAQWQERQKDWERLQRGLARKMGRDPSKMMMADSNDFRERLEEYQTVLASVPLHERSLGTLWERSLRNGGTRLVPVGNIFSGLFCPVSSDVKLPRVVRRPKLPNANGLGMPPAPPGKSWRDDHALADKKKHLRKYLSAMRPHEVTPAVSRELIVVGQDLLKWAHDSSKDHFEGRGHSPSNSEAIIPSEGGASIAEGSVGAGSLAASGDESAIARGPRLLLGPSPYVLLEADVKEPVEGALTMQNMGSTTLFYEWTRLEEEGPSLVALMKRRTADGEVPSDPSARFAISKDASESRFLCQNASGVLIPGQARAIVFAFESTTPGSFAETWKLKVTPPAAVLGDILPSPEGLVTVSLLGAAMTTDTNEHRRLPIRHAVERSVTRSKCEQLIAEVVRDVRTPERQEALHMAQKIKFESLNVEAGLNFTPLIYEAFANLWIKVNDQAAPDPDEEDDDEPLPPWDGDVNSIRRVIDGLYHVPESIVDSTQIDASAEPSGTEGLPSEAASDQEESEDDEEESEEEKDDGELAVIQESDPVAESSVDGEAPVTEPDVGEMAYPAEEEEEEEDEGEEEEAEEEILEPAQAAQKEADLEWKLLVARAAARPLPTMANLIVDHVSQSLADAVVDAVVSARAEVQGARKEENDEGEGEEEELEHFEPLPSPFGPFHIPVDAPTHGAAKWEAVLNAPPLAEGEEMSAEQQYRKLSYEKASAAIGGLIGSFSEVAAAVHADALASFAKAAAVDLSRTATLRVGDDVLGKRVVLYVDLDVGAEMISDPFKGDEYGIPEGPKPLKLIAAAKLARKVLKGEPHTIMLLSELTPPPPEAADEKHPVPALGDLSLRSLEPMLAAFLKVPVAFCGSVDALEEVLAMPDETRPKVVLLDHCDASAMVPLPEAEVVYESEPEDDRLPWLGDPKDDPGLKPMVPPERIDLGGALLPHVDVFVCDTPSDACLDPKRSLSLLRAPEVFRVAGPGLHKEVVSSSVLLNRPRRPLLAVVCGDDLLEEVKHIDRMIDLADDVVISGRIGLVFLAALGHKTGALKHDPAQLPMARALLAKAQMLGVPVTLPVDFVMGDVLVDAFDQPAGSESMHGDEEATGGSEDDEPPEVGAGFDYDGETLECTVSEGLMRKMHALDLGNQTIALLKELVEKSNTVVWTGLVGVAQCSAFQNGSRELMEAVVAAHEDRNALVVLGGAELVKWGALFADLDQEGPNGLGDGNGVTHAFKNLDLAKRLLAMVPVPGVEILNEREPTEMETMLEEEVRAKRLMDGTLSEDDEDDEEFGGYDDDGDFGGLLSDLAWL